ERVAHGAGERADRHGDDDELGAGDRIGRRRRPLQGGFAQRGRVGVPPPHGGDACTACGERDRRADEPRSHDREPRDLRGRRPFPGTYRSRACVLRLLFHDVEDGGEQRAQRVLAERAAVCPRQLVEELGLALRVDQRRAGLLLVRTHLPHELEAPVERVEDLAVDGRDAVTEGLELVSHGCSLTCGCGKGRPVPQVGDGRRRSTGTVSAITTRNAGGGEALRLSALWDLLAREGLTVTMLSLCLVVLTKLMPLMLVTDSWLAFVSGRTVAAHGLPHHDSLTLWTLGRQWTDQQWGAQFLLYETVKHGGVAVVVGFAVVCVVSALVLIAITARKLAASARSVALALPLPLFAAPYLAFVRSQIFAVVLFVAVY